MENIKAMEKIIERYLRYYNPDNNIDYKNDTIKDFFQDMNTSSELVDFMEELIKNENRKIKIETKIEKLIRETFPQGNNYYYVDYMVDDMSDVVIDGNFDLKILKEDLLKLLNKK